MSQIEEIKKLYAKPKTYKIPKEPKKDQKQISITIHPLALDDMSVMSMGEKASMSEVAENAKKMFSKSLKISEEEAGQISIEFMEELLGVIMDANNFKEEDIKKAKIDKFMKSKQKKPEEKPDGNIPDRAA